jgi:hypothetical protein
VETVLLSDETLDAPDGTWINLYIEGSKIVIVG